MLTLNNSKKCKRLVSSQTSIVRQCDRNANIHNEWKVEIQSISSYFTINVRVTQWMTKRFNKIIQYVIFKGKHSETNVKWTAEPMPQTLCDFWCLKDLIEKDLSEVQQILIKGVFVKFLMNCLTFHLYSLI